MIGVDEACSIEPTRKPLLLSTLLSLAAQGWAALLALICVPVYIRVLGMEAFGLIGFYYLLQALLRALDLGLTPTVVREMARASATGAGEVPALARTFELLFTAVAVLIALGIAALAPWLAADWVRSEHLPLTEVTRCVLVMGVQCGVNWLSAFYQSALLGLERQVCLNALRLVEMSAASLGAIALIVFISPRVELVFYWQLGTATAALLAYALALRQALPGTAPRRFRLVYLQRARGFAAGMTGITLGGLALAQMDKIYLSKTLPLEEFGDYSLAALAAATVFAVLQAPVAHIMYPRFAALVAQRDADHLRGLYHLTVQLMAVLALPIVVVWLLFARDFFECWTGAAALAPTVARLSAVLAIGMLLNTLMVPAYFLQLAHGWTTLGLRLCLLLLVVFGPLLVLLTHAFGPLGAAAAFAAMNGCYLLLGLPLTHRRFLPGAARVVVVRDLLPLLAINVPALFLLGMLPYANWPMPGRLALAAASALLMWSASALVAEKVRAELRNRWRMVFGRVR
jgi:O-antigen/teichoic acid export membrane protein